MKPSILLLIVMVSCKGYKSNSLNNVQTFTQQLGEQESEYLNQLVKSFEAHLDSIYKDQKLDVQYEEYLNDLAKNNCRVVWKPDSFLLAQVKRDSKLLGRYDYPDSVAYNPLTSFTTFNNGKISSMIDYLPLNSEKEIRYTNSQVDSIIVGLKNELVYHGEGTFFSALDSINPQSSFIKTYLKEVENPMSGLGICTLSWGLLHNHVNLTDYFIKRMIVVESILE